ncbi:uncharacterized protein METZ01_LOCUS459925 [marine metagenome]|uniref:Uncharacterized protein n=1 Tax=marine metagenome TaxID=408172 RepID=A0A383AHJ6_9ZZZZ
MIFYPSVSGLGNSGLSLHSGILSSQGRLSSKPHDNVMKIVSKNAVITLIVFLIII